MPKQQYLSKDNKGWKLRRRVPEKLQELVGKTQWVERLSGANYREACERAKIFGVKTDAEIKKYEGQLKKAPSSATEKEYDEPGFIFELTDHEIDQIAIAYFHEMDKAVGKQGGYRKGVTESNRDEILIDLVLEYEHANALLPADFCLILTPLRVR